VHTSPWLKNASTKPSAAFSIKAGSAFMMSSKKMFGDLPPSSTVDGMMFSITDCP